MDHHNSTRLELNYTIFETDLGWIGAIRSKEGLRNLTLPQPSPGAAVEALGLSPGAAASDTLSFGDLPQRLRQYLAGEQISFPDPLDLSETTSFQRAVWEATLSIPSGETRSYSWVAERIGKPKAARAVGRALATNPIPLIIPCHRVIGVDGSLCGFGGGLEMKKRLLDQERASYQVPEGPPG